MMFVCFLKTFFQHSLNVLVNRKDLIVYLLPLGYFQIINKLNTIRTIDLILARYSYLHSASKCLLQCIHVFIQFAGMVCNIACSSFFTQPAADRIEKTT